MRSRWPLYIVWTSSRTPAAGDHSPDTSIPRSLGEVRRLRASIVLAGLSLLAVAAPAGEAISQNQDSVTGTAVHLGADPPFPAIQVSIDARSKADGSHQHGSLSVEGTTPVETYRGKVTCLNVAGDQATIGIQIVKSTDPAMVGQGQLWSVVDSADPATPDRVAGFPLTATPPIACPPLSFNVPVVSGDYQIHDASP